jgi:hypothetical protein
LLRRNQQEYDTRGWVWRDWGIGAELPDLALVKIPR